MSLADLLGSRASGMFMALLAGVVVALALVRLGRDRFAPQLLGASIALGALSTIGVMRIDAPLSVALGAFGPLNGPVFKAFLMAGFLEEGAKLTMAYLFVRRHYLARTPRDVVLGTAAVALGFALVENIGYVANANAAMTSTALVRAVMSVPGHVFTGLVLGFGLVRAEGRSGWDRALCLFGAGLAPAALLHGCFDLPLFIMDEAPLFPPQILSLAQSLWTSAPVLLETFLSLAVAAECAAALFVMRALEQARDGDSRYRTPPVQPVWLNAFVFAPATGERAAAFVLIAGVATFALACYAMTSGALAGVALNAIRYCLAPATLAFALFTGPRDPAAILAAIRRDARVVGAAVLAALLVAVTSNPLRNGWIAANLTESAQARLQSQDAERGFDNLTAALGYSPDNRIALMLRADVEADRHDYDHAFADVSRVVAADARDVVAVGVRAQLALSRGDYVSAKRDLDAAVAMLPNNAHLLTQRAVALRALDDSFHGDRDLDRAMRVDVANVEPYVTRVEFAIDDMDLDAAAREIGASAHLNPSAFAFQAARVRFLRGDFAGATAALRLTPDLSLYPAIWRYLAAARAGGDGGAELKAPTTEAAKTRWPYPIVRALSGEIVWEAAQALASDNGESCEVDYYSGEWRLARGERGEAVAALRRAADNCPRNFIEHSAAAIELRNLGASRSGS